jgi:hypothetical protein
MIKYENSTLKIYIRNISKFMPISIQLLTSYFPVNKIDRENSDKIASQVKFEVNQIRIQKL